VMLFERIAKGAVVATGTVAIGTGRTIIDNPWILKRIAELQLL